MIDTDVRATGEIRLWEVYIPDETAEAVHGILESGWLNTGKQEALFMEKLRDRFNISFCLAVNNGTAARLPLYRAYHELQRATKLRFGPHLDKAELIEKLIRNSASRIGLAL
ncbi:DegT/DnrJ/EryC1/StrS family aminotransferase [Gammaproteobacteria bacterium]|nr:DegT/DnrJ/EryC1/StrS family aminotransferase [Gammaproteobacteria bacterium]